MAKTLKIQQTKGKGVKKVPIEVFNRYEYKYLIDSEVRKRVEEALLSNMELDEYNKKHELYTISNIYYDTEDNYLIRQSLSKPKYKEKLRLRSYGVPKEDDKVFLEIKKKFCGLVNKRRTRIRLDEAYDFLASYRKPELKKYMNGQILNEIEYLLKKYELKPMLYLAYDRKAFFSKENRDLRITFDTNIRTRRYDLRLEMGDYGEQLLDDGMWLMEVKAEKSIPLWLARLLSENRIYKIGFSKYGKEYERMIASKIKREGEINVCSKKYSIQPQLIHQSLS